MWNSQRTLGSLGFALLLGVAPAFAGDLSNVSLGRFQDFTVVILFGDGPMTVTHQIVEAKDGKPHRIVVDVTGALHKLPQNNFADLPEGSITTIRTSQFAVSPEPVVRVVLDLAHPAAYRLETPESQVRIMVSLPGDPPLAKVWSARGELNAEPFESAVTLADASQPQAAEGSAASVESQMTPAASETIPAGDPAAPASESADPVPATVTPGASSETPQPAEEQPAPAWTNPAKSAEPGDEIKALPLAPSGSLAVTGDAAATEAALPEAATVEPSDAEAAWVAIAAPAVTGTEPFAEGEVAPEMQVATDAPPAQVLADVPPAQVLADVPPAQALADVPPAQAPIEANTVSEAAAADSYTPAPEQESAAYAEEDDDDAPQIPMPEGSIDQPERVIDYNLPIPAALAGSEPASVQNQESDAPSAEVVTGEPRLAVTSTQAADAAASQANPKGSDAAVTDLGSAPVASLSTLPPLVESAADLVPQRTQVIYHTQGRRDPFKALLQSGGYNAAALPDVSALRLVGLLHDVQESWGLFEDANGYGYILKKGDRVKNGSLTQLTNNRAYFSLTEFGWSRSVHIDLEPEG